MSIEIQATSRNFDQYFTELKQQAQAKFGSWTKFSESNIGTLMLELMAMVGDQNSFYLNRAVNEAFLPTVKQRRNAQKILKRMDYALGGRTPASVDLTFTPADTDTVKVFVNGVLYANGSDYTIAGVGDKTIVWSAVSAGFNLEVGMEVIADYYTNG